MDSLKGQLAPERHGGPTLDGVSPAWAQRLLTLAAAIWFNWDSATPDGSPHQRRPLTQPS